MQNEVKVLIAEDEPNALAGLAELISGWGYRTETARDGLEAWEKTLAWDPAIVVTDLKMPRMDGMALLGKLAEGGAGVSVNMAVVVLTAMGSVQLAVEAMKLGAYDFLQKPVDATRLKTILANAARQRDTAIELEVTRRRLRETGASRQQGPAGLGARRSSRARPCPACCSPAASRRRRSRCTRCRA